MAAGAAAWQRWRTSQTYSTRVDKLRAAGPAAATVAPTAADPSQGLTPALPADQSVGFIERTAADLGVGVLRVEVIDRSPSERQLGQTDLNLSLRGTYRALKSLIAEVLARYPTATVRALRLQTADSHSGAAQSPLVPVAQEAVLAAQLSLVMWSPALGSAPSAAPKPATAESSASRPANR